MKNRSRWRLSYNYNPKLRFNKPTGAVSLPALIIVDDIDEYPSANNSSLSKPNSEDVTSHRRHSDKTENSSDVGKLKKNTKPKSNEVSKYVKVKVDKITNSNPKQAFVKKAARDSKDESIKAVSRNKAEVCWRIFFFFFYKLDCKSVFGYDIIILCSFFVDFNWEGFQEVSNWF